MLCASLGARGTHWTERAMLPGGDLSGWIDVSGRPEDEAKHRLDVYAPKRRESAPVFLFLHGGAWRFGDKMLYPPFGQRFAKEGIVTVIPSYRLAPKCPWPAQAEDTAAVFILAQVSFTSETRPSRAIPRPSAALASTQTDA